jgi:hypothetical protein
LRGRRYVTRFGVGGDADGTVRSLQNCARASSRLRTELSADALGASRVASKPAPQPAAKARAAERPSLAVPVDHRIGIGDVGRGVKQLGADRQSSWACRRLPVTEVCWPLLAVMNRLIEMIGYFGFVLPYGRSVTRLGVAHMLRLCPETLDWITKFSEHEVD